MSRIGPFRKRSDVLLAENEARRHWDRVQMVRIWDLLLRDGCKGSYDAVRRYAARYVWS